MCDAKVVHIEPLPAGSSHIRVGPAGWQYGDPYELCMVCVDLGDGVAELRGVDKPVLPSHWRAINAALRAHGFKQAVFTRMRQKDKPEQRLIE